MGLFSSKTVLPPTPTLGSQDIDLAEQQARRLTAATPEEQEILAYLASQGLAADENVLEEMRALKARGEDLSNVDQAYMERAYQPAYERLMHDYKLADQGVLENLNARGIAAIPGGTSEQEAYQRSLLARDTKESLARNMLEAQNQAVQQKLAQYNARLGETNQANVRHGQTMQPYVESTVVPESERMSTRTNAAANIYNARLGHSAQMHQINTERKLAGQQGITNMIGGGMGVLGSAMGALALSSKREMKKDIEPGPNPEQSLDEVRDIPVDRWRYRWEDESTPPHEGAISDQIPEDMQAPQGIDVASYLGKLTNSIKALDQKVGAFERLMKGGLQHGL